MPAHFLWMTCLLPLLYCKPLDKTKSHSNLNIKVQAKDVDCVGIRTYGAKRPIAKRNFEICVVDPRRCDNCIPKSNCGDFCVDQHSSCGNACGEKAENVLYHPATIQHMIEEHHYCEPGNERCEANPHHKVTRDSHDDGTVMHESQLQSNIIASDHDYGTNYVPSDHHFTTRNVASDLDFRPNNFSDYSEHTDGNMIAHGSIISENHVVEPIHHHLHHHHHQHHHHNDVTSNAYNIPSQGSLLANLGPAVEPSEQLLSHEESVSLHGNDLPRGVEDLADVSKINPKLEHNELERNDAAFTLAQTDASVTDGQTHPHDSIGMHSIGLAIPPTNDVSFTVNDPEASHNTGGNLPMDDHSQSFHDHSHLFHDENMIAQGSLSSPRDPVISETQAYTSRLPSQSRVGTTGDSSPLNPLVVDTTETHDYSTDIPAQGITRVNDINSVHDSDISHAVPQGHVLDNAHDSDVSHVVPQGHVLDNAHDSDVSHVVPQGHVLNNVHDSDVSHVIPLTHGQELSPNAKHICNCNCNKESNQNIPKVLGIETVQYSYNTGNRFPCGLCTSVDARTPATCTAECCRCKTYCEHA